MLGGLSDFKQFKYMQTGFSFQVQNLICITYVMKSE